MGQNHSGGSNSVGGMGGTLVGDQYKPPDRTTNNLASSFHTKESSIKIQQQQQQQPDSNTNNNTSSGNLVLIAASNTSDALLMSIAELVIVLQQLGEIHLVVLLEEISRHYYEIQIGGNFSSLEAIAANNNTQGNGATSPTQNLQGGGPLASTSFKNGATGNYGNSNVDNGLKKYINCAKYTPTWLEDEGVFGGGGGIGSGSIGRGSRISIGATSGNNGMDEDDMEEDYGVNYNTDSAFQVWLIALKDRQLPRFKRKLEKLFVDNSGGARKVAFSFNVQMSTSSTNSLRRASSFLHAQTNPKTNYVIDMDSKQKYFEVRSEMEIILTHTLEEIKDLKECLDAKRKIEGGTSSTSGADVADVSVLLQDFDFECSWWEKKIGSSNFSVKKKAFIDAIEETFAHLKVKFEIEVLEEISDPTCDGVVSVTDLKTLTRWLGSIYKWNTDELKLRNIAGKEDAAPVIFLPHFWGSVTCYDAQDILQKEEPGTYIIRFNENEPGHYYISCVQENVVENEETSSNTGFFATRQVYHFVLKRGKTEKGEPYYYLSDADKSHKFKTITELLDKNYFLTFKYPYVNDDLKSAFVSKKRDVDVFGALKSLSGEGDDLNPYPFVVYKGKFNVNEKKKESDMKKIANLAKKTTEPSLGNPVNNNSSSSIKDQEPGMVRVDSLNLPLSNSKEETLDLSE